MMADVRTFVIYFMINLNSAVGFNPNLAKYGLGGWLNSKTHKQITETSVKEMAKLFMSDHPDKYPNQEAAMATNDFKEAIRHFTNGAIKPDIESHLRDLARAHFDDGEIEAATNHLIQERVKVIAALTNDDMSGARDLTGQILHTLQDFYSHSNWVEMNDDIYTDLGQPQTTVSNVAGEDDMTCTDCLEKTCYNNIADAVKQAKKITTGYKGKAPARDSVKPGASGQNIVDEIVQIVADSGIFPDDKCLLRRIALAESKFGTDVNTYRQGYNGGIWQVDEIGFDDTKDTNSHPGLTAKHTLIEKKFGIVWSTLTWTELKKPLYSALAARLKLSVVAAAIPSALADQANYWKQHYNSQQGAGTAAKFKEDVESIESSGDCPGTSVKANKCAHGGGSPGPGSPAYSIHLGACGGINKDTSSEDWSPHFYLHEKAAEQAEKATTEWLKSLRTIREDTDFGRYLGLSTGSSLCFVVDTTGSMIEEIEAVRSVTQQITTNRESGPSKPSEFVLVPFNDPEFGPTFKTADSLTIKSELAKLTADGGKDTPELAFSGMRLALQAVRPGSECYVFTDAPAKDADLAPEVTALAVDKKVKMNFFLTNVAKRRRRSLRLKRQSDGWDDLYKGLAEASGGNVWPTPKGDIDEATSVVDAGISTTKVTILQADDLVGATTSSQTYNLPVDLSMVDILVQVTSPTSLAATSIRFIDPSGAAVNLGSSSNDTLYAVSELTTLKLYKIPNPDPGVWTLNITSSVTYSLSISASSLVDFSFRLVEPLLDGHAGYRTIDGKPLAGLPAKVVVDVFGGVSSVTGNQLPDGLKEVTSLTLMSTSGDELEVLTPVALLDRKEYEADINLPAQGFRVVLRGVDTGGNMIQRYDKSVVTTSLNSIRLQLNSLGSPEIPAGESVNITVTVTNIGQEKTFSVSASDSEGFLQSVEPESFTLESNNSLVVVMRFTAPEEASLGTISTVTVSAAATDDTTENFLVFRISASPKDPDLTPPACNITELDGMCNETINGHVPCQNETWVVYFTVEDDGIGLAVVRPTSMIQRSNFTVNGFEIGTNATLEGQYTSDCCNPRVVIATSDLLGNTGYCTIDHIPLSDEEEEPPRLDDSNFTHIMLIALAGVAGGGVLIMAFTLLLVCVSKVRSNAEEDDYVNQEVIAKHANKYI